MDDLRDTIIQTAERVEHIQADIAEVKESFKVIGAKVVKQEVVSGNLVKRQDKHQELLEGHSDALSSMKWVPITLRMVVGSIVGMALWIIRQALTGK